MGLELGAAETPGHIRWVVRAAFEIGEGLLTMVFAEQGDKIVGETLLPAE